MNDTFARSSVCSSYAPTSKKSSMDKSSLLEVINEERRRASFPDKKVTLTATSHNPKCPNDSLSFYKAQSCAEVVEMGIDKMVNNKNEPGQEKEFKRIYTKNVKKLEYRRNSKLDTLSCREVPNITIIPTSSTSIEVSHAPHNTMNETVDLYFGPKKIKRNNSVKLKIMEQQIKQKKRRASNNQLPTSKTVHQPPSSPRIRLSSTNKNCSTFLFNGENTKNFLKSHEDFTTTPDSQYECLKAPQIPEMPVIKIQMVADKDASAEQASLSSKEHFDSLGTEII